MPRAKASNKKGQTKAADAKTDFNNIQEQGLADGLEKNDIPAIKNGSANHDELKENEVQAPKRSGRGKKNEKVVLAEEEETPKKKPATKGRGKKKSNESEVIENAIDSQTDNTEVVETVESVEETANKEETVTKSKGKSKKAPTTKKTTSSEKNVDADENLEDVAISESKTKTTRGRKKKEENIVATENDSQTTTEKAQTSSKNSKNVEENLETVMEEEPPKKRGKASKKESSVEKVVESLKSEEKEDQPPAKKKGRNSKKEVAAEKVFESLKSEESLEDKIEISEKKPTKRNRAANKVSAKAEDNDEITANEEVLPKKRSRKAPSVDKEIVEEKPKKGRGKKKNEKLDDIKIHETEASEIDGQVKSENIEEMEEERSRKAPSVDKEILEEKPKKGRGKKKNEKLDDIKLQETEASEIDGQVKSENIEEMEEESTTSNKRAAKKPATTTTAAARGGRKRAAPSTNKLKTAVDDVNEENNELVDEADDSKSLKTKKKTNAAVPLNSTTTLYNKADFDLAPLPEGQTADEPRFNLKISSWNVAGLRSWLKKDGLKFLDYEQPDIFCMQETKCTTDQLPEEVVPIPGYHPYWLCMPGGYAGVAIYSKIMPINVEYGIGSKEFDDCGRIITAEYEKFYLVNVYVPNSGRKLVNLESRMKWEKLFQDFLQNLNALKAVVVCGDMNVSHQEHDLANPKSNTRNAGFTKEERDKMSELLSLGYIDTFRHFYPDRKGAYTYWTYMANARSRNVGWRLDYFIVSERFIKRVVDNCIRSQCMGSDHCPITLFLKL